MLTDWHEVVFSDFCDITRGGSPRPIHDYIATVGIPWVKIADVARSGTRFIDKTKEFIRPEGESKSRRVFPGDLILSNSATPGIPMFMGIEACIHDGWMLLRNFRRVDKLFVFYLLQHERGNLLRQGNGSVFTNLKTDILKSHRVKIPLLDEQRAIASVLGALDDKIEQNRRTAQALEKLARAIFRAWFVDFEPVKAKVAGATSFPSMPQPVFDALPMGFVDSAIGPVPDGWAVKVATKVATVGIGKTPPRKEPQWFSQDRADVRWASIKDMGQAGVFIEQTSEYLTEDAVERCHVRRIPDRSVLFSFKLTVGRVAITDGEMTSNEAIAHFTPNDTDTVGAEYLYCYLSNFDHASLGSTSSIATATNSKAVKAMPVLASTDLFARAFTTTVRPIFELLRQFGQESRKLAEMRDYLLPRLLSGTVRVEAGHG